MLKHYNESRLLDKSERHGIFAQRSKYVDIMRKSEGLGLV